MDFSSPVEVESFRNALRAWLAANLTDDVVAAGRGRGRRDAAFETLRAWDAKTADAGWAAVSWPKEFGGRGATVLEQLAYAEETTRARAPLPLNVIGLNNIAPAIMQYGSEAQNRTLLPRMMRADDIWCQGMSEPEAGSDLASLRTRAVRDGDDFVVNGQKIWTSLGQRADWCQLYVRTDPDAPKHKGISCLIVDMALPGIEVRPIQTLTGDSEFAELFFNDVRVPANALLGPLNGGWQVATTTLSHERAGAARLYAEMQLRLQDLAADLSESNVDGRQALEDTATLRRLGRSPCASSTSSCCVCGRSRQRCTAVTRSDRRAWRRPSGARWVRSWPPWVLTPSARQVPTVGGRTIACRHAHSRLPAAPPRSTRTSPRSESSDCRANEPGADLRAEHTA